MAYTINYRRVKGTPLTNDQIDDNFLNLDTYKSPLDSPAFTTKVGVTGQVTAVSSSGAFIASGSGTGATSVQLVRPGAATDQKTWEILSAADGSLQLRSVNDAYAASSNVFSVARGAGTAVTTMSFLTSGGRIVVGSGTDDGINALQVTGGIAGTGSLNLTSTTAAIELGAVATPATPVLDFHTSGNNTNYDVRIAATGGTATVGQGGLTFIAAASLFTGRVITSGLTDDGVSAIQAGGDATIFNGLFKSTRFGTNGGIVLRSAAGTSAAPTKTLNGSVVGVLNNQAFDGTNYQDVASIDTFVDADVSTTSSSGYVRIATTPSGTVAKVERMRVTSNGHILIGQVSDDNTNALQVTGGIASSNITTVNPGLAITGLNGLSAGMTMTNTTSSNGKKYSIASNTAGGLSINDETAAVNRMTITSAGRILLGGVADNGVNSVQVNGTFATTGTAVFNGGQISIVGFAGAATKGILYMNTAASAYLLWDGANWTITGPAGQLYIYGYAAWHTGNLPSPASTTGATFSGGIDVNAPVRIFQANYMAWFSQNNSYAASMRTDQAGFLGALNSAQTQWNMQIYEGGTVTFPRARPNWAGLTPWDTGNLANPMSANGGSFGGGVDFYATVRHLSGSQVGVYSGDNSYAAFMAAYNGGMGFLNVQKNAWNMQIDDGGNTNIRGNFWIQGTQQYSIAYGFLTSGGNVGQASGTVPQSLWAPSGRAAAQEFDAVSDRRVKENIETLDTDRAVQFVKTIRPVNFTWIAHPEAGNRFGYIAQEVSKAGFTELLNVNPDPGIEETIDEDGFVSPKDFRFSVNYDQAVPLLTAALANALERIEALEALIKAKE